MIYFSTIANYCMENKRSMFVFLLFFHVVISVIVFSLAHTEYFSSLHNGKGIWNFAIDSTKYHGEALNSITYIQKSAWSDWWYLYQDHQHVKAISLIYWLTGYHSPISFEIVNCVVWTASFVLIIRTSELLFPGDYKVPLITSIFFFQPSILISSTQLLRDPIYILGFCFMIYGFTIFLKQNSKWRWVFIVQFGFILMVLMRSYISIFLLILLILFVVIAYLNKRTFVVPFLVLLIPLILFHINSINRIDNYISVDSILVSIEEARVSIEEIEEASSQQTYLKETLDAISRQIDQLRNSFYLVNINAGSRIDVDSRYGNVYDVVLYLPRAMQIGFLSPFPSNWLNKGSQVGTIGNLLIGLETIIWYFILLGFIYITYKNPSVIKPFSAVFLISITLILLLSYVVPNIGAIYRMRQSYMIPFYLFGAHGLTLMISNFTKKQHK